MIHRNLPGVNREDMTIHKENIVSTFTTGMKRLGFKNNSIESSRTSHMYLHTIQNISHVSPYHTEITSSNYTHSCKYVHSYQPRWSVSIYMYKLMYFCMYICMYVCVRVYVCMYVCMYVCTS